MSNFWALSFTLYSYLFIRYIRIVLITVLILTSFIAFIDIIELVRRASNKATELSSLAVVGISLLNLPSLLDQTLPFGVLFGSMICFYFWGRSHEFLVARASGQNIWQALLPVISAVFCLGLAHIIVINPIASATAKQHSYFMKSIFGEQNSTEFSVLTNGIWIRDNEGQNKLIINGDTLDIETSTIQAPIIYRLMDNGKINWRMQAKAMRLSESGWIIHQAIRTDNAGIAQPLGDLMLPTSLRSSDLVESKLPPKTISIYRLPNFISVQKRAGLPVNQYLVFFHQLLSTPLKLVGIALLAASFTITVYSRQTKVRLALLGIGIGFSIYFLSDIIYLLGNTAKLPYLIAGWGPAFIILLLSGFFLARSDE